MSEQDNNTSDENDGIIHFDSRVDNREFATELVGQATRTLRILTYDLENAIYDNAPFIQAVTTLVKRSRHSKIHILIKESSQAIKNGHRLIELARRFPSFIHLQRPLEEDADSLDAFIVADESGYIYRRDATRPEGIANFHGPLRARQLRKAFDTVWEKSTPDPEMLRLHV